VPAGSLLTLLDDIATVLDDVSVMTKVAAKKTAGVLGDDLALNAQQLTGVASERELPVVWTVAKGSALNKLIIVPGALAISALAPWAITPLLMLGGLFLCYEGCEKVVHKLFPHAHEHEDEAHHAELTKALQDPGGDMLAAERDQIRGAIRTDVILSAEIIVITLGVVADKPFGTQVAVLCAIAVAMTVGVYGLVAGIVKMDDAGLALSRREGAGAKRAGAAILWAAPRLLRLLGIAGTIAMFLVGGGIVSHGIPAVHHEVEHLAHAAGGFATVAQMGLEGGIGLLSGAVVLGVVTLAKRLFGGGKGASPATAG
jgi:predicted DNA repair protein MutK